MCEQFIEDLPPIQAHVTRLVASSNDHARASYLTSSGAKHARIRIGAPMASLQCDRQRRLGTLSAEQD